MSATVSNKNFLVAVFGDRAPQAHVCGFKEDPADMEDDKRHKVWFGGRVGTYDKKKLGAEYNTYFTISIFRDAEDGKARRRKELFEECYVIPIDDVGTKVSEKELREKFNFPEPTYRLETSPGNEQWGYVLTIPEPAAARVNAFLDGAVALGISEDGKDPGMKGVTRYCRLPVGSNTKKKYINGHGAPSHRLISWDPDLTYLLDDLAELVGIDLSHARNTDEVTRDPLPPGEDKTLLSLDRLGLFKTKLANGRYDITCPWVEEHSEGMDDGTAYLSPEGFKCHHGHCEDRTYKDLREWLENEDPEYRESMSPAADFDIWEEVKVKKQANPNAPKSITLKDGKTEVTYRVAPEYCPVPKNKGANKIVRKDYPIPDSIFEVRGILKPIFDYMNDTALYPQPMFALGGALAVLASVMGRSYRLEGLLPNLYQLHVGPSVSGKDNARKCVKQILRTADEGDRWLGDSIASAAGIEDLMKDLYEPCGVFTFDEFGKVLQRLIGVGADDHGVMKVLLDFYTASGSL